MYMQEAPQYVAGGQAAGERRSLRDIKQSGTELQAAFEQAYAKPSRASDEHLAALYFQGGQGPATVAKSSNAPRPTGHFANGGTEPLDGIAIAGKKQFKAQESTAMLLYGNYGAGDDTAASSVKPYSTRLV